jgi:hypothetical protein
MRVPRRYRGFLDDDGSLQWDSVRRHLRSQAFIAWARLQNRFMDARAVLAGSCNASTWTGKPPYGYAGGYSHWRCGKRRGHHLEVPRGVTLETGDYGPHRFINYIWDGDPGSRAEYSPLPIRNEDNSGWFDTRTVIPFRRLADGRRAVERRSRSRLRARWSEKAQDDRRADVLERLAAKDVTPRDSIL